VSTTSLSDARTELYGLLQNVTGVTVLDHEPRAITAQEPVVTIFCDGYSPTEWRFTIRVYSVATTDQTAQIQLDTLCPAVEDALDSTWYAIEWTIAYSEQLDILVASLPIMATREDI
jgi:hypothetical protein